MNKFQEALDKLSCSQDNPTCECVCGCEKSDCKYVKASITLQELIDKQEKYRWHDLRENTYDLPRSDKLVLVYRETEPGKFEYAIDTCTHDDNNRNDVWNSDLMGYNVIKWKYIDEV